MMRDWGVGVFVVFLVLKLTHYVGWSWVWVTAPLWIVVAVPVLVVFVLTFMGAMALWIGSLVQTMRRK